MSEDSNDYLGELEGGSIYGALYDAVNEMMAVLGRDGEISTVAKQTENVMDVLRAIDGGQYKPKGWLPPEEVEKLRRDAERYRWLERSDWYVGPEPFIGIEGVNLHDKNETPHTLACAIDAAMAQDSDKEACDHCGAQGTDEHSNRCIENGWGDDEGDAEEA